MNSSIFARQFLAMISLGEILSITLILFSVIDILGSVPVVIDLRKKNGHIQSAKATLVAGVIMVLFLIFGDAFLGIFGIDVGSFAIAGSIIIFILGMEMVLGREFFKSHPSQSKTASIVPIAFPLIAGAGTLTTIVSLKAEFDDLNIFLGILVNLIFVYIVLKSSTWIEKKIGEGGIGILQKVFGIILLSIAIKLFKENVINLV